ncbi:MAG: hypothetical protein O3C67_13360 [Cyanobacteria bacterium]|nr:hypothetical protein [Cyanobacteriota bacterium]MEB3268654.1 hypothetical protein [Leptolyngbya sp.]
MLPQVILESQVQPFTFWFNGGLQDGIHHADELYYRLQRCEGSHRAKLYQLACKLSQRGADVVVTMAEDHCSLWANLRNQKVAALAFSNYVQLPTAAALLGEPESGGNLFIRQEPE